MQSGLKSGILQKKKNRPRKIAHGQSIDCPLARSRHLRWCLGCNKILLKNPIFRPYFSARAANLDISAKFPNALSVTFIFCKNGTTRTWDTYFAHSFYRNAARKLLGWGCWCGNDHHRWWSNVWCYYDRYATYGEKGNITIEDVVKLLFFFMAKKLSKSGHFWPRFGAGNREKKNYNYVSHTCVTGWPRKSISTNAATSVTHAITTTFAVTRTLRLSFNKVWVRTRKIESECNSEIFTTCTAIYWTGITRFSGATLTISTHTYNTGSFEVHMKACACV